MEEFIYKNNCSLDKNFCENAIKLFEESTDSQFLGSLGNSKTGEAKYKPNIKNTTDISIHNDLCENSQWFKIHKILKEELIKNMNEYYKKIDPNNDIFKLDLLHINLSFSGFLMSRYTKNKGIFKFHNDFNINVSKRYRIFNFLWYLNDVEDGGKTVFFNNNEIKPEQGKMIIFPSEWFFTHKGEMPVSCDKYIITGWIYNDL